MQVSAATCAGQRFWIPEELELWAVVSCVIWVPEPELDPLQELYAQIDFFSFFISFL